MTSHHDSAAKHTGPSDSDFEDDTYSLDERPSAEIFHEGQEVLKDDYESDHGRTGQDKPLGWLSRVFSRGKSQIGYAKPADMYQRKARPSRRHRERRGRGQTEEEAEMMYEMEEGGDASLTASTASSEVDVGEWKEKTAQRRTERRKTRFGKMILHIGIILFFLIMLYGAYRATKATRREKKTITLMSNGTSLWAPTTLVISLDGFRADFLERGLTPTLNAFVREGVSPLYMFPPFPSVTFVSHYSMSTGMYAEQHGIVGNTFWDPDLKEEFFYTHTESSMQPKWWGGEPFWVTAEKQGLKTAIHMWPGSEAHIAGVDLDYVDHFKGNETLDNKVNRVLGWLDMPGPESVDTISNSPRPQLIVAYIPDVDADGHLYGPNSTEIRTTISAADNMLTGIFDGIKARNLTEIVNVIIVSDHGMATTSVDRLIQLEDLVDVHKLAHIDGWPLYGLRPTNDEDIESMYHQLKAKSDQNPYYQVYLRDGDMPPEYHFAKNPRIAPIWIVPETGWAIVKQSEFDVNKAKAEGLVYHPRGLHGYDFRDPLMRAIFVARGPAFSHEPHSRVEAFKNIEVYNIICDSLGIDPSPNSGSLRLPFKPVGLHSDKGAPKIDIPDDLPDKGSGPPPKQKVSSSIPAPTPSSAEPTTQTSRQTPTETPSKTPDNGEDKPSSTIGSIWNWLGDTLDGLKDTIKGIFGGS